MGKIPLLLVLLFLLLVEDCKEFLDKDKRLLKKSKGNIIEIDRNTVKQAIMRMKNGRAAGPGDIPIESEVIGNDYHIA